MQRHFDKFDMLRGVLAIAVLIPHSIHTFISRVIGIDHFLSILSGAIASHAVLIFFLMSGYLIANSIQTNFDTNQKFDILRYVSARFARIYPPLICSFLVIYSADLIISIFQLPGHLNYGINTDVYRVRDHFRCFNGQFFS